ncbi:hypothetical protein Bca52824_039446 [Brassica carinata]|uniref:Uncharacterized protein n=1 Tax=Brassica carinata TaxID=52824 RepID=A0A8X7RRL8_BRACI|nr:hypothetical protein Bca52824_039446 [Brassica carinata]
MVDICWINASPHSYTTFESGDVSDHMLMHTQLREVPHGNIKSFKFFNHVASHPRFLEVVSRVWNDIEPMFHSRSAVRRFYEKLNSLKSEMISHTGDMFRDFPGSDKEAYEEMCTKQTKAMQNPQTSSFEAASDAWYHSNYPKE